MLKNYWLALTLAYFASLNQFYEIFLATNRFSMRWSWVYHVQILAAIIVLGSIYFAGFSLLRMLCSKSPILKKLLYQACMVFAWYILARCAVSMFVIEPRFAEHANIFQPTWVKCLIYVAIPGSLAVFCYARFRRFMTGLCLVLSPVLILIVVTPLTYKSWDRYDMQDITRAVLSPGDASSGSSNESNLYFFLFDEWSADRILESGAIKNRFSTMVSLSQHADLYLKAYSPGNDTILAVPKTLLQMNRAFVERPGAQVMGEIYSRRPLGDGSIFSLAPEGTYRVAVGLLHDFDALLGDSVDRAFRIDDPAQPLVKGLFQLLRPQLAVLRFLGLNYEPEEFMVLNWGARVLNMKQLTLRLIREVDRPVWAYLHFALPHQPFIWERGGQLLEQPWPVSVPTEEGYLSNMDYIDALLGEFFTAMKEAGTYDNATIIITSDHGLRGVEGDDFDPVDPLVSHTPRRHVPLIVKKAGQDVSRVLDEPTELADIFFSGLYLNE